LFLYQKIENLFALICRIIALLAIILLFLVAFFIAQESLAVFKEVNLFDFLTGMEWKPLAAEPKLGILPIILATVFVAVLAVLFALPLGIGCALELAVMD